MNLPSFFVASPILHQQQQFFHNVMMTLASGYVVHTKEGSYGKNFLAWSKREVDGLRVMLQLKIFIWMMTLKLNQQLLPM
jgi:hypothetical protein